MEPWGSPLGEVDARRRCPGLGDGVPRRHGRQRRAPVDGRGPARRPRRPAVGARRVPRDAHRPPAARRRAGRPLRAPPRVHDRRRRLRRGVGAVRRSRRRPARSSPPGRCRAQAPRCSCRAAWPCSPRRSARTTEPRAIGAWSGLAGVAGAAGPFIGGWLVDAASWRWAFLINVPLGSLVLFAARHVPESARPRRAAPSRPARRALRSPSASHR